jgi:hypothetical protein
VVLTPVELTSILSNRRELTGLDLLKTGQPNDAQSVSLCFIGVAWKKYTRKPLKPSLPNEALVSIYRGGMILQHKHTSNLSL